MYASKHPEAEEVQEVAEEFDDEYNVELSEEEN